MGLPEFFGDLHVLHEGFPPQIEHMGFCLSLQNLRPQNKRFVGLNLDTVHSCQEGFAD
jgi:hypothetical protein